MSEKLKWLYNLVSLTARHKEGNLDIGSMAIYKGYVVYACCIRRNTAMEYQNNLYFGNSNTGSVYSVGSLWSWY
ncbi:hypothetical protein BW716_31685 [[Flexibacter] sp. ATCC 35208]|nr:hypothetical protein BW716_31685 [[Flexibacter] sp. ATCC 35208]